MSEVQPGHQGRPAGRRRYRRPVVVGLAASLLGGATALATVYRRSATRSMAANAAAQTTILPTSATPAVFPVPVLPANPLGAFRLTGTIAREVARVETVPLADGSLGPVSQAQRVSTNRRPSRTYDVQLTVKTVAPVEQDDILLATFYVRGVDSQAETGEARTAIIFEQASDPYTKSLDLPVDAGPEWRRIDMPFKSLGRYAAGQAQVNFQLGFGVQTIEIGGVSVVNYKKQARLQDLPVTRFTYPGREPDAAWRGAAAERIEAIRKADLTVIVKDAHGWPVPGATVEVKQRRHAFGFGSAVAAAAIMGQGSDNQKYRETVTGLFSKVVLENDLKWPNWEDVNQRERTLRALQWLHEHGLTVRGHNLVWPSWRNLPRDLPSLRNDPTALRRRVHDHVLDEVGTLQGQLVDWDMINEPFLNHDLMDILGQEVMVEWFQLARQADPDARLFLNEATVPADGDRQDAFESTLRYLIDAGTPLDGIGFQCHFGWSLAPPERLLRGLDRFVQLGKAIQITEFDVDVVDEELQADYMRDFLTAAFSHPAVDAILMWGFWAGRHWRPDAALFRRDWSIKPNGQVWQDLVTNSWWTDTQGQTDRDGVYRTRGFLGDYTVEVTAGDQARTTQVSLPRGGTGVGVTI